MYERTGDVIDKHDESRSSMLVWNMGKSNVKLYDYCTMYERTGDVIDKNGKSRSPMLVWNMGKSQKSAENVNSSWHILSLFRA